MPPSRKTIPRPKSFKCPQCGGPVPVRHPERAMSVVCPYCQSILDTSTPHVSLIQAYDKKTVVKPRIPLGARARLRETDSEVVGFMRRGGSSEGYAFHWDEYLLYNPYLGYRFLAETQAGWQLTSMTNDIPKPPSDHPSEVKLQGRTYTLMESYTARVTFVLGEFYWQVSVGEKVRCIDYKSPPYIVMAEVMEEEYTWSAGSELTTGEVWKAFNLPGTPPTYAEPEEGDSSGQLSPGCILAIIVVVLGVLIFVVYMGGCEGGSGSGSFFSGGK